MTYKKIDQYYSIIRVNPTRLIFEYGLSDGIIIIDVQHNDNNSIREPI